MVGNTYVCIPCVTTARIYFPRKYYILLCICTKEDPTGGHPLLPFQPSQAGHQCQKPSMSSVAWGLSAPVRPKMRSPPTVLRLSGPEPLPHSPLPSHHPFRSNFFFRQFLSQALLITIPYKQHPRGSKLATWGPHTSQSHHSANYEAPARPVQYPRTGVSQ